jgi:amino acid transporter
MGTVDELTGNHNLFMDRAYWSPAVLAGLLDATFSSALAGSVGGPRILMAMGDHRIMPKSEWLAQVSDHGEPRNAVMVTAILTFIALLI